jgi:hypothetical protein
MAGWLASVAIAQLLTHRVPPNGSVSIRLWSNIQYFFFSLEGIDRRGDEIWRRLFLLFRRRLVPGFGV